MVHRLGEISNMKSCEKKEVILEYLGICKVKNALAMKRTLFQNVPYCLQAPFMESMKGIYPWIILYHGLMLHMMNCGI